MNFRVLLLSEEGSSKEALTSFLFDKGHRVVTCTEKIGNYSDFDLVIVGSGRATTIGERLGTAAKRDLMCFVRTGGAYMGICAGAYLALKSYNSQTAGFQLSSAEAIDVVHWNRGSGKVRVLWDASGIVQVRYESGPLIGNPGFHEEVVAVYEDGLDTKMSLAIAALRSSFAKGRYFLFSFHPEMIRKTHFMLEEALSYLLERRHQHVAEVLR